MRFFLFSFTFFLSLHVYALESETHYWYTHGYYTKSIHALRTELKTSNSPEKKSRLYYDLSKSYYAISFVEEYRNCVEVAYKIAKQKKDYNYNDDIDYQISMVRYYNFQIKPNVAFGYFHKIYSLLRNNDPQYKDVRWIKIHQTLATTRRNAGSDYSIMSALFDSSYLLIKKHKLLSTINEVEYFKSRGNMNLDRVGLKPSDSIYYSQAIKCFSNALILLKQKKIENYPSIITFQCLKGLVSYMRGEYKISKSYFDEAFKTIEIAKYKGYATQDLESIYLNVINWSSFPISMLYQKNMDISLIEIQLRKLKSTMWLYQSYSKYNRDVDLTVFTDVYGYSPYNSIVSCYTYLFQRTKKRAYLDTAFYYGEMNKTQWSSKRLNYSQFVKQSNRFVSKGNTIIQYGEFGFVHHNYLYAIVKNSKGIQFKVLGLTDNIHKKEMNCKYSIKSEYAKQSNYLYEKIFKPLEVFIESNTRKIVINKSGFLEGINIESLIYDTTNRKADNQFLLSKYAIFEQPSFRIYSESKGESIYTVSVINPVYRSNNRSQIHFTSDLFSNWTKKNKLTLSRLTNSGQDLCLIAAHGYANNHRVGGAYFDFGNQKLTIKNICLKKRKCKLTILASCDSGLGQKIGTGSSFSLASAFLFSGASSCVYSTSKLDDKIASQILADFLQRLKNGEPKDWALRNAKLAYLKHVTSEEGYNPIYWAGLQVMGDVSPVEIGKSYVIWYYIVGLILLVGVGFVIKKRLRFRSA